MQKDSRSAVMQHEVLSIQWATAVCTWVSATSVQSTAYTLFSQGLRAPMPAGGHVAHCRALVPSSQGREYSNIEIRYTSDKFNP